MVTTAIRDRVSPFDIGTAAASGGDARHALKRAGLDFDVDLVPVLNPTTGKRVIGGVEKNDDGSETEVDKFFATIRRDTSQVLGIVEGRYEIFANRDIFSIADNMVEEDGAVIDRANAIDGGARCFMQLSWPKSKAISVEGDIVGRRAILQNSHNGKYAAMIRLMPLRLACINGMVVPVPAFTFEFRIKHTESGGSRLEEARRIMAGASQYFETFGKVAARMAKTPVPLSHAKLLLKTISGLNKETDGVKAKRDAIADLFNGGQVNGNHQAVKGTAWGLLNAVAEYADHRGKTRQTFGNSPEIQKFKSALEGSGQRLKLDTFQAMLSDKDLGLKEFYKELAARN